MNKEDFSKIVRARRTRVRPSFSLKERKRKKDLFEMYVRCKRTNQTVFLYTDQTEKVSDVLKKISGIVKTPVDQMGLVTLEQKKMDNDKTLGDYKVAPESILYWVQKKEGLIIFPQPIPFEGSSDFEEVNIQKTATADTAMKTE